MNCLKYIDDDINSNNVIHNSNNTNAPLGKFEIKTLGNAISSILGINKSVVRDNFYWPIKIFFDEANGRQQGAW